MTIKVNDTQNSQLKISLIAIGDEILNGRTRDLNAHWLSKFLFENGVILESVIFIKDDTEMITKTISEQFKNSDVIITSGGIGPTKDDLTKDVIAKYFSKSISASTNAQKIVEKNYERLNRKWVPEQNFYHMFPQDFIAINNPKGFAPGFAYKDNDKMIFSAPGVPKEFNAMVSEEFFPIIRKEFSNKLKSNFQTIIRTFDVPEEHMFTDLCPSLWNDLEKFGKVSSLPHVVGVDIVISHHTNNQDEFNKNHKEIINLVTNSKLTTNVWQFGNRPLQELLVEALKIKNLTISFAESCTGGLCASKITDISGSSEIMIGGVVSYANSVKINPLNVNIQTLNNFGAVSVETAQEMAKGVRELTQSDIAISTTGIAGPGGGSENKPVGTVCIGLSTKDHTHAKKFNFNGDRLKLKDRFSERALLELYLFIK